MVFKTPAMRVRVQKRDDLIANTARVLNTIPRPA